MRISVGWVKAPGIIVIGCALVIGSVCLHEKRSETALEEAGGESRERYDKPGERAEFYRFKRLPEGETEMPIERYFIAREKMRELPIYSTVHNHLFPSRHELMSSAPELETAPPALLDGWKSLGPGNVGGRTRALLVHPSNPDVIYAAAARPTRGRRRSAAAIRRN